ncbi:hypothetical protein [Geomonas sp.]|uniref:hypothetical protein n=1 Tax=Geomonas sp. TaxID=2651584 RepID=UPI002B4A1090|nr:hypothetical protein [Geomonas sp.]HJV34204.1 hypothetical protein [Geomonas sp.]
MKKAVIMVGMAAALLAGCSSSNAPQKSGADQGRPETKTLEGASAVGYDGSAVRKTVDTTLNNNDAHNREIDSSLKDADHDQQKH